MFLKLWDEQPHQQRIVRFFVISQLGNIFHILQKASRSFTWRKAVLYQCLWIILVSEKKLAKWLKRNYLPGNVFTFAWHQQLYPRSPENLPTVDTQMPTPGGSSLGFPCPPCEMALPQKKKKKTWHGHDQTIQSHYNWQASDVNMLFNTRAYHSLFRLRID